MIPQLYSPAKGRRCSESCLDLLAIQLVRYYQKQNLAPAAASVEAIGDDLQSPVILRFAMLPAILLADEVYTFNRCTAEGFRVGRQLVERYTQNRPRLGEHLDVSSSSARSSGRTCLARQ